MKINFKLAAAIFCHGNCRLLWLISRAEYEGWLLQFTFPSWSADNSSRFQPSRIFWDCLKIKHHASKSQNTINLPQIKAFSSTFKENPKFLFFHSPKKLFFYKLTSYSTASSTIFKYFKSHQWCLFKNSSLPWKPHPKPLGPAQRL